MGKKTRREIHNLLQSSQCKEFILNKLSAHLDWRAKLTPIENFSKENSDNYIIPNSDVTITHLDFYNEFIPNDEPSFIEDKKKEPENACPFRVLKKQGVIAGGAIAAWVNEFIYQVPAVINDIDWWFVDYSETINATDEATEHMYANVNSESYGYDILEVKEEGVLNSIKIDPATNFSWLSLVESFDLNCCKIAFNPFSQEFNYSIDFLDFLISREIKLDDLHDVNNADWPLVSVVRAQLKTKELAAKFQIHKVMNQMLLRKIECSISWEQAQSVTPLFCKDKTKGFKLLCGTKPEQLNLENIFHGFQESNVDVISEKRFNLWKENPTLLEPWLTLSAQGIKYNDWCFEQPWVVFLKDNTTWISKSDYCFYLNELGSETNPAPAKSDKNNKISELDLPPMKETDFSSYHRSHHHFNRIINILKSNVFPGTTPKPTAYSSLAPVSHTRFKKIYKEYPRFFTTDPCNDGLSLIKKFNDNHDAFVNANLNYYLIINLKYSINEIIEFYSFLSKLDLGLLGILESWIPLTTREYPYLGEPEKKLIAPLENRQFRTLEVTLKEEYIKQLKIDFLIDPIPLKIYWKKYAKELTFGTELILESVKMHHCVRGYAGKVKEGKSRIFHLKVGNQESTLEIKPELQKPVKNKQRKIKNEVEIIELSSTRPSLPELRDYQSRSLKNYQKNTIKKIKKDLHNRKFTIVQHKSFYNQKPHPVLLKLAKLLVNYLNDYNDLTTHTEAAF